MLGYNNFGMLERNEGDTDDTLLTAYEGIELWKLVGIVVDSTVGKIVRSLNGDGPSVSGIDNIRLGLSDGKAVDNDGEAERPTESDALGELGTSLLIKYCSLLGTNVLSIDGSEDSHSIEGTSVDSN